MPVGHPLRGRDWNPESLGELFGRGVEVLRCPVGWLHCNPVALKESQRTLKQVSLGVELTQQTLEDRCPGKVLYESGLYLVEQVQIGRNRQVSIWSDTWMRETIAVVTPRTQAQLESDQDALLRQFIDALNTR